MMKSIVSMLACLLICGSIFADEKIEVEVKKPVVVKVVPKVGVPLPVVRPLPGKYHWEHPQYGWGRWYYPAPVFVVPADYYFDQYGRVVPNGYAYNPNGDLVPLVVVKAPTPYYVYPYRYYNGRWFWGR